MAMNSSGFKGIVTPQMSAGGLAPSGPPTGAIPTSIGVPPKQPSAAPPPAAAPPPPGGALNAAAAPPPGAGAPPAGNPVVVLQKVATDAANACGRLVAAMKAIAGPNAPAVEQAAANLRAALMAVVQAGQPKGGPPTQ